MSGFHPKQTLGGSLFPLSANCTALRVTTSSEMQRLPKLTQATLHCNI